MTVEKFNRLLKRLDARDARLRQEAMEKYAKNVIDEAIRNLPEKTYLHDVSYRDELTPAQVGRLIDDNYDYEDIVNWEWEIDSRDQECEYLFAQALPDLTDEQREDIRVFGNDRYLEFIWACEERDASNPLLSMLSNTGNVMFRINVLDTSWVGDVENGPVQTSTVRDYYFEDSSLIDEKELQERAEDAVSVFGAVPEKKLKEDGETNLEACVELVQNATYGGNPCFIVYLDASDLFEAITDARKEKVPFRMSLIDPHVLIYDGLNGSGHDVQLAGEFEFETALDKIPDVFHADARDAGTGYSWSEDIACTYNPAYACGIRFAPSAPEVAHGS